MSKMQSEINGKTEKVIKKLEQNRLIYAINEANKTAELIDNNEASGDVFIPRSINYQGNQYIVTAIKANSFKYSTSLRSIIFPVDSEVRSIGKNAFFYAPIEKLNFPASLCELEDGWCNGTENLKKIQVMPNNRFFMNIDNRIIVGKSDINNDDYDVLYFSTRGTNICQIPSFIKKIATYAFYMAQFDTVTIPRKVTRICRGAFSFCSHLRNVIIPSDSNLRVIERKAFYFSSIESLSIPASLEVLEEGWCAEMRNLKKVTIDVNNKYYKHCEDDENLIVGKSDINNDEFDVVVFACKNIRKVKIPENIKRIASYAFYFSLIKSISIPSSVTHICEWSFYCCHDLCRVDIQSDSNLRVIDEGSFADTSIKSFYVPSHVIQIDESSFNYCRQLEAIEIDEKSELQSISLQAPNIMLPVHMINRLEDTNI